MWTYQLRYVRCGKPNCRSCPHGPYWYKAQHRGDRVYWRYVGKMRDDDARRAFAESPREEPREQRWSFTGRMNAATAMRIMGFSSWPTADELKQRWRVLMAQHHPDRGGSTEIAAAINAARDYLQK
jgi:hypothetical protein